MWELDNKKGWASKNRCLRTVVLEKTLEDPLDSKEIKLVNLKGNQPWIFIGRTDTEALILRPPDAKNWLIGRDPDAGKDWRQKETGVREIKMVEWHHSKDVSLTKLQETVKDREVWCAAIHGVPKSRTRLSDWTTTKNEGNKQGLQRGSFWNLLKWERTKGNWYCFASIPDYL